MKFFNCKVELVSVPITNHTVNWNWKGDKIVENSSTEYAIKLIRNFKLFNLTIFRAQFYIKFLDRNPFPQVLRSRNEIMKMELIGIDEPIKTYTPPYTLFPTADSVEETIKDMVKNPNMYIFN